MAVMDRISQEPRYLEAQAAARVEYDERAKSRKKPLTHYEQHHALIGRLTKAHRMMELIELDLENLGGGQSMHLAVRACRLTMTLQKRIVGWVYRATWQYSDMMREEEHRMERLYAASNLFVKKVGGANVKAKINPL